MPLYAKQVGKVFSGSNYAVNGSIVLPDSVENYRLLKLNQTTAGVSLTLPTPVDTSIIYGLDIINIGTEDVSVEGYTVKKSAGIRIAWESTAWVLISNTSGGSLNVTTGPMVPASGMIEGDVHCYTSAPAGQEYLVGTSVVYDGTIWQDQSNNTDWQIANYISSNVTITHPRSTRYVVVPPMPLLITMGAGSYNGQTIWLIRGGDWDTNSVNILSSAGVSISYAPGPTLTGNEIASISFTWHALTSNWFATYHSSGQTVYDKFQVGDLASRPATPTDATIYYVTGDATPAENDRWYVYDTTTALWYEMGNAIQVVSNTTSTSAVYPTFVTSNATPLDNVVISESKASFIPSKGRLSTTQLQADLYITNAFAGSDYATNGLIGTAPTSVDVYSMINIPQTTTGITLTLPAPTVSSEKRTLCVNNTGTTPFTMHGTSIENGKSAYFSWTGTSWSPISIPATAIPVLSNNTSTSVIYPTFLTSNASPLSNVIVSDTQITFQPSTGRLSTAQLYSNTFITESYLGSDMPTGGAIGSAASTVDSFTMFNIPQTTATQTLSLPVPTTNSENRIGIVTNTGTTSFVMHGTTVEVGKTAYFAWNGSSWSPMTSTSSSAAMDVYDTTTTGAFYPTFLASNTSPTSNLNISSTRLSFRPSTGKLSTSAVSANAYTTFAMLEVNYPAGGIISPGAASSVDIYTMINIPQTTAGQTLSLPSPSVVTEHRTVTINNTGSAAFTMYGTVINPAKSATFTWNGTAWSPISISTSAAGSTSEVQFNTAGAFNANSTFTYDVGTQKLSVANVVSSGTIFANTISANGTVGTAGQILTSDGTKAYWASSTAPELFGFGLAVNRPAAPADGFIYYTEGEANPANDGYVFIYDSATTSWRQLKTLPGGGNYHVQFNNGTVFDGDAAFTFNPTTSLVTANNLTVTRTLTANVISANGTVGTAGQVLKSDGTKTYWGTDSAGAAGSPQQVQYNTAGALDANADFTYNAASSTVNVRNLISGGTVQINALNANGTLGTAGQILTTDGTRAYWASGATFSVNTAAQYSWTNTHSFSNTITLNAISANGSIGTIGQYLTSDGTKTYWSTPTISIGTVLTGTLAARPASATEGDVYVVSGDTVANNGKAFIYDATTFQWFDISPPDQTANDARYVNVSGDAMTGPLAVLAVSANGSIGSAGQVLTSDGTKTYWSTSSSSGGFSSGAGIFPRPPSPPDGFIYFDTASLDFYIYDSATTNWSTWRSGTGGATTPGGISSSIQVNSGGTSFAGFPDFTYTSANGTLTATNTIFTNVTIGNRLTANGSPGTAGQVLTSDGTKTYWSTITGGSSTGGFIVAASTASRPATANDGVIFLDTSTGTYSIYDTATPGWFGWTQTGGGSSPGGSNTNIQYNNSGTLAGATSTSWYNANSTLAFANGISNSAFSVNALYANGSIGTSGQVLTTDGTKAYWSSTAGGGMPIAQLVNTTRSITYSSSNIYAVNGSGITITLNNGTSAGQQLYFYRATDWSVGGGVLFSGSIVYPSFSGGANEVAGLVFTWNGAQWIGTILGQPATGGGTSGGISVGLLGSRPASGADGQLYFVSGDPAPGNNGQLWAYDTATTTWYLVSQTTSSSAGFRTISFIPSTTTALNNGAWTTVYSSSGWNFTNGLITAEVLLEINNSAAGGEILGRFQLNGTTLGQEVHLWKIPNASMAGGANWLTASMTTIGGVSTGQSLTFQLLNNGGTNNASFLSIAGRESKIIVHGQS